METNFKASLEKVLVHEGGYVNHPSDPGGATNKGITIATYRVYIDPNGTDAGLKALTTEQAGIVYRNRYWNTVSGDLLPSGVDYAVFDFAVNSGPDRARRYLQSALGVTVDGVIGPQTLKAANAADPLKLINTYCDRRLSFLMSLKTWGTFGKGWSNRVAGVRSAAIKMIGLAKPTTVQNNVLIPAPVENKPVPSGLWAAIMNLVKGA